MSETVKVTVAGSGNFGVSAIHGIMRRLKATGIEVMIYQATYLQDAFFDSRIIQSIRDFKAFAYDIISSRNRDNSADVGAKIFARHLIGENYPCVLR